MPRPLSALPATTAFLTHSGDGRGSKLAQVSGCRGVARLNRWSNVRAVESEEFAPVKFRPAAFAAYHLGNNGTAQVELHRWNLN